MCTDGTDALVCSVALSGQAPKPHSGAPQARGLTANARTEQTSVLPRCAPTIGRSQSCRRSFFSAPAKLGSIYPHAMHDDRQPSRHSDDCALHPTMPGNLQPAATPYHLVRGRSSGSPPCRPKRRYAKRKPPIWTNCVRADSCVSFDVRMFSPSDFRDIAAFALAGARLKRPGGQSRACRCP